MFEYKQIIHRMRLGESDRAIAKAGLVSRTKSALIRCMAKINGWLNPTSLLPSEQEIANSLIINKDNDTKNNPKVAPFIPVINKWVEQGISGKVIHRQLVEQYGFIGAYNCVQRYVQKIKNNILKDLTVPMMFAAGEAAQVDFGKGPVIYDSISKQEVKTWIFVMTLCFSRHQYAEIILHQDCATWLSCHIRAFNWFGGVVKKIIIDNAKCAITKASFYDPEIQRSYGQFAEDYGFIISACPPYDPSKKGIVEAGVKYVKGNFLPLKSFKDLADSNRQLQDWILNTAGNRNHGTTKQKPLTRFHELEKNLLKQLPEIPTEVCVWKKVICYRDCHVKFEYNRYSVPYKLYKQLLWLKASANTVKIYKDYQLVAMHCRSHQVGETITLLEHLPPNAKNFFSCDNSWCLEQAKNIGVNCLKVIEQLLNDQISDCLRAAQGVIKLGHKYGVVRLELACKRTLDFGVIKFKTIKEILANGLEEEILSSEQVIDKLGEAYAGKGKFCRNVKEFIVH